MAWMRVETTQQYIGLFFQWLLAKNIVMVGLAAVNGMRDANIGEIIFTLNLLDLLSLAVLVVMCLAGMGMQRAMAFYNGERAVMLNKEATRTSPRRRHVPVK